MNAVLFQLIEPNKIPWNATRGLRSKTRMEKGVTTDAGILNLFDNEQEFILHSLHYPCVVHINISSPSGVERVTNEIYI